MKGHLSVVAGTILLTAVSAQAAAVLYTGEMAVMRASGKYCASDVYERLPDIDMVLDRQADGNFRGYYTIQNVKIGKISGSDAARLSVTYPFSDRGRAEGHVLSLVLGKNLVSGTLQEKGMADSAEGCAIEYAEVRLSPTTEDGDAWFKTTEKSYRASVLSSEALGLVKKEQYAKAIPLYQEALATEEEAQGPESPLTILYLDSLASAFGKNNQSEQGIELLKPRLEEYSGPALKFLSESLAHLCSLQGDTLYRDKKYTEALPFYRQAMETDTGVSSYPAGVARTLIRLHRPDEAAVIIDQVAPLFTTKEEQNELDQVRKELADVKRETAPAPTHR